MIEMMSSGFRPGAGLGHRPGMLPPRKGCVVWSMLRGAFLHVTLHVSPPG